MEAQRGAADKKDATVKEPPLPELRLHLLDAEISEDVLSSYRRREAAWISLVTHGIIIALLLFLPKWTGRGPVVIPIEPKNTTILPLPDDLQKVTKPKTDILSDKDRMAQTNKPAVDKDFLRKLLAARRPGPPKAAQPPPAPQQAMQQPPAPNQGAAAPAASQPPPTQNAQLQAPQPTRPKNPFKIASPGETVNQAVQSVASSHGAGAEYGGGDYGSVVHPRTDHRGAMEIMSDTLGVDFGPYMKRLHFTVQNHWDPLIPIAALPPVMKKGIVVIEFSITKDGKVEGMKLISSSGDVSLDRAAWGAVTDAIPLPNLPVKFTGQYLTIRASFYYNPDKADLQ